MTHKFVSTPWKDNLLQELASLLYHHRVEDKKILYSTSSALAECFILGSLSSSKQVEQFGKNLTQYVRSLGVDNYSASGYGSGNWFILDMNWLIIHIFRSEVREYYQFDEFLNDNFGQLQDFNL